MATGSISGSKTFASPVSLGCTMPANTYPNGSISFSNMSQGNGYWIQPRDAEPGVEYRWTMYLCDSAGNCAHSIGTISVTGQSGWYSNAVFTSSFSVSGATDLTGKALYLKAVCNRSTSGANFEFRGSTTITINTAYNSFNITVSAGTGGSCTASHSSAAPGTTITLYPTASTGYYFSGWTTSPSVTVSNNKFTMPSSNISVTANFTKTSYSISKGSSPSGAGTVTTSKSSATMGESITVSQTPATGYYFNGWTTSPSLTISGGAFTMPASNVSITARYLRRSTASVNKTSVEGGSTITMTISTESTAYTHKYQLSFGTGMATSLTNVAAGTTSVTISVPLNWSASIPSATSKSGGTLKLETYSGSTKIGEYTVTGLTYTVPASVKPTMGTLTVSRVLTIGGVTYPSISSYYVQNHCGVRTQCSASGQQSATISSMKVTISGYSGNNYSKTVSSGSIDFTSALLYVAGSTTITVTATDSRGRTNSSSTTITVQAYASPTGSIRAWRVDSAGDPDDMGTYAKYELTKNYTALNGYNTLNWTVSCTLGSASNPATTDDLMPNDRKTFSDTQEYTITLTLTDSLETVTITTTLPSARFIMYVDHSGDKIGFMKVPNQAIPSGKNRTFEISADTQIYIGNMTLEDYIRSIT